MAAQHHTVDLLQAIENRLPYDQLSAPLRRVTLQEYERQMIRFAALRCHGYHRLPDFVRAKVSEERYYETMLSHLHGELQLYPYYHICKIIQYTKETPLSYYTSMLADLLKTERSYDTLPNFTAVDVLNLLGIGRNQYLELTKEVRSKLRWHINRGFVKEHLPTVMLPSITVPPFWFVYAVKASTEALRRAALSDDEKSLYRYLSRRSAQYEDRFACEFPHDPLNNLYRRGLVCGTFAVNPDDQIVVPPLERFVMNRTSDDPQEVLLYRVLATIDGRTPLSLLAQLLMLSEEDVCAAAHVYIRLGLAHPRVLRVPAEITTTPERVHTTWGERVDPLLSEAAPNNSFTTERNNNSDDNMDSYYVDSQLVPLENSTGTGEGSPGIVPKQQTAALSTSETAEFIDAGGGHPAKRIALLYDASLTGFLMMTNLSADPTFKQHAVTLFELGKLSEEMIGSFVEKLEQVNFDAEEELGGEAVKYVHSVLCLREVLKELRRVVGPDRARGVDMLKVEAMNELEPTTRYSVLGRNYWAYFVVSPVSYAPLIDVALNGVYGSTVSLMPSPWMTLYLYDRMGTGPASVFFPVGARLVAWPPALRDSAKGMARLRLQPLTMDAEVTYVDAATSVILANEITATAPLFVQKVAEIPLDPTSGCVLAEAVGFVCVLVCIPFTATESEATELLHGAVAHYFRGAAVRVPCDGLLDLHRGAVEAMGLVDSIGSFTFYVSLREGIGEDKKEGDGETGRCFRIDEVFVVDVGLGIPLTDRVCCAAMLPHFADILKEARGERHNDAMRKLATDFGDFLQRFSPLTAAAREKMALQSTAVAGPTTHQHIRRLGEGGNGGAPFPNAIIAFDGKGITVMDDCNPLVEMWNVS